MTSVQSIRQRYNETHVRLFRFHLSDQNFPPSAQPQTNSVMSQIHQPLEAVKNSARPGSHTSYQMNLKSLLLLSYSISIVFFFFFHTASNEETFLTPRDFPLIPRGEILAEHEWVWGLFPTIQYLMVTEITVFFRNHTTKIAADITPACFQVGKFLCNPDFNELSLSPNIWMVQEEMISMVHRSLILWITDSYLFSFVFKIDTFRLRGQH